MTDAQAPRFIAADRKRLEADPALAAARSQAQPDKGWDYSPLRRADRGAETGDCGSAGEVSGFHFCGNAPWSAWQDVSV